MLKNNLICGNVENSKLCTDVDWIYIQISRFALNTAKYHFSIPKMSSNLIGTMHNISLIINKIWMFGYWMMEKCIGFTMGLNRMQMLHISVRLLIDQSFFVNNLIKLDLDELFFE